MATRAALADVCHRFELGELREATEITAGTFANEPWRVITDRGEFFVKRLKPHGEPETVRERAELGLQLLEKPAAAAGLAVATPVVEAVTGKGVIETDAGYFRAHHWIDGTQLDRASVTPEIARRIGDTLTQIHALAPAEPDALLEPVTLRDRDAWLDAAKDIQRGMPEAATLIRSNANRLAELQDRTHLENPRGKRCRGHGDVTPFNTINGSRLAIVDWDRTKIVVAAHEATATAGRFAETHENRDIDEARFRAGIKGYVEGSGLALPAEDWVFGEWVNGWVSWTLHHTEPGRIAQQGPEVCTGVITRGIGTLTMIEQRMPGWLQYIGDPSSPTAGPSTTRTGVGRTSPGRGPIRRRRGMPT